MPEQPIAEAARRDRDGRRDAVRRVLVNALLVLLVFEAVSFAAVTAAIAAGASVGPMTPGELFLTLAVFLLVRWVAVLPGMLPVLVGIESIARRVPHARILTAIVAFSPMVAWELTKTPGPFPSEQGAILGATAIVFGFLARLPPRTAHAGGTGPLGRVLAAQ